MKAKVNRTNITDHLIEYQLKMVGKTVDEIKEDEKFKEDNKGALDMAS